MDCIQPAIDELHRIFDKVNERFALKLPTPVITIQTRGRSHLLGWFEGGKWETKDGKPLPEINLCAEELARSADEIAETVIHETAHFKNFIEGKPDCNANQYHNKAFKEMAEALGLEVEKSGSRGYAYTKLGLEAAALVAALKIDPEIFSLFRRSQPPKEKAPTRMKKWTCGCGIIVRCAKDLYAECTECGEMFQMQE
jgi:hypothetical protein